MSGGGLERKGEPEREIDRRLATNMDDNARSTRPDLLSFDEGEDEESEAPGSDELVGIVGESFADERGVAEPCDEGELVQLPLPRGNHFEWSDCVTGTVNNA